MPKFRNQSRSASDSTSETEPAGAHSAPVDPLAHEPFSWFETKTGTVHIQSQGRTVTTLTGRNAQRFLDRAESADPAQQQQLMARATGQFKFGNER